MLEDGSARVPCKVPRLPCDVYGRLLYVQQEYHDPNPSPSNPQPSLPKRTPLLLPIAGAAILLIVSGVGLLWYKAARGPTFPPGSTQSQELDREGDIQSQKPSDENYIYKPPAYTYTDAAQKKKISSWVKMGDLFYFLIYEYDRSLKSIRRRIYRTPTSPDGLKEDFHLVVDLDEIPILNPESFRAMSFTGDNTTKTIFLGGIEHGPTNIPPLTIFSARLDEVRQSQGWKRSTALLITLDETDRTNVVMFTRNGYLYAFQRKHNAPPHRISYTRVDSTGGLGEWRETQAIVSTTERPFILDNFLFAFEDTKASTRTPERRKSFSGQLSAELRRSTFQPNGNLSEFTPASRLVLSEAADNRILDYRRSVGILPSYKIIRLGNKVFFVFYNHALYESHLVLYGSNEIELDRPITLKPFLEIPLSNLRNSGRATATLSDDKKTDFTDKERIYTVEILE